ncbi:MAG: DNA polymerase III subunit beta [Oscillospiraceae bacterium]|jgi:DNA polymerase-3 subunit beta|nr:DNA polymerase III subunit beta [Oscillospiraceae bacterium]
MRFTCSAADMGAALFMVTRAIATRPVLPILEGVRIASCEGGLRLTCTDLALGMETQIPADVQEPGSTVLPGKLLSEIVRKLPEGTLEVQVNARHGALLLCAGSRTNLSGMAPEEFPALPEVGEAREIELPQSLLREMIQRTSFAIASDESRPVLTGCLLETAGERLTVVALDGFRLAMRNEVFSSPLPELSVVVPGKVLNEIARILKDSEEMVKLHLGGTHLLADMGDTRVVARLLDGEFVRYRQVLPKESKTRIIIVKKELETAMERASLMAREGKNNLVRLHMADQALLITSNAELGDVREEIPVTMTGDALDIAFNVRYLTDTLRAIEDEEIVLQFNNNISPCVILPTSGEKFLYLALPVRVYNA